MNYSPELKEAILRRILPHQRNNDESRRAENALQVCLDSGAKKILLPSTSFVDFATVPPELMSAFQIIPYQSAEDAVFKALGVE